MLILWKMNSMQVYTFYHSSNYIFIIYILCTIGHKRTKTLIMSLSTDGASAHQPGGGGQIVVVGGHGGHHEKKSYLVN